MSEFVSKYISGKEYKWVWFLSTFIGGLLPMILSAIISTDKENLDWKSFYSAQDLAFLGLTMNIANFNLVSKLDFKEKDALVQLSFVLLIIVAALLGYVYSRNEESISIVFGVILHILVAMSVILSMNVNNYVHETVTKRAL